MHILVADDDRLSVKLTTFLLESSGYSVSTVCTGQEALKAFDYGEPDLVLLDVELPNIHGFEVCRQIRRSSDVPIVFLSAHNQLAERVQGLQIGADDYIGKPFEPLELLARIEAVLRRRDTDTVVPLARLRQGDITLDPVEHKAFLANGRMADLTPIEFRLLYYLMKNAGRVLSADQILNKVWRYEDGSGNNLVAVYIRRLRAKIEHDVKHPRYIITLPNLGYRFEAVRIEIAA
jgi:DNA-binding response OmpR family regulator